MPLVGRTLYAVPTRDMRLGGDVVAQLEPAHCVSHPHDLAGKLMPKHLRKLVHVRLSKAVVVENMDISPANRRRANLDEHLIDPTARSGQLRELGARAGVRFHNSLHFRGYVFPKILSVRHRLPSTFIRPGPFSSWAAPGPHTPPPPQ